MAVPDPVEGTGIGQLISSNAGTEFAGFGKNYLRRFLLAFFFAAFFGVLARLAALFAFRLSPLSPRSPGTAMVTPQFKVGEFSAIAPAYAT